MPALSFFRPPPPRAADGRHDETTGGEPGLREWAEGRARLRDSTCPNHGPRCVHALSTTGTVLPPKARRAVDTDYNARLAG